MNNVQSGISIANNIRELAKEADSLGLIRVTAEQLHDWANAINPDGYIVQGHDLKGFVRYMSSKGRIQSLISEALALYGLELHVSEDTQHVLDLRNTWQGRMALHVAGTIVSANPELCRYYDYNLTFRIDAGGDTAIAMEGVMPTNEVLKK